MQVLDYGRSFVTFVTRGRGNNARLQVESVCTLTDVQAGTADDFFFFASCKSEDTFAARNLFYPDNYDFCGIFSAEEYAIFRTRATHADGFRDQGAWRDRFENVVQQIVRVEGRELAGNGEVVQASLDGIPLVGVVEIKSPDGRYRARLEFPVKTMNANDIRMIWQVDTGPLPFPDFAMRVEREIERFSPAYVAYNVPDFADFVVQQPLAVGDGAVQVDHYSGLVSLPARTRVVAV